MRATAHHLSPASVFLITSLREQTGVQDGLCRCVCTAAPPVIVIAAPPVVVVAAPPVVVVDITSDTEEDENMADVSSEEEVVEQVEQDEQAEQEAADTEVDTEEDEEEVERVVVAAAAPPTPATRVTSARIQALYDYVFDD